MFNQIIEYILKIVLILVFMGGMMLIKVIVDYFNKLGYKIDDETLSNWIEDAIDIVLPNFLKSATLSSEIGSQEVMKSIIDNVRAILDGTELRTNKTDEEVNLLINKSIIKRLNGGSVYATSSAGVQPKV